MTIDLSIDKSADIGRFIRFMNHPQYPGKRAVILKSYPEISEAIEAGMNDEDAVKKVLDNLYRQKEGLVKELLVEFEKELSDANDVIKSIGNVMEYDISDKKYHAILTFLPFGPIMDDTFFFSIFTFVFLNADGAPMRKSSIACSAVHEISHFVFFEELKKWKQIRGKSLNHPTEHYFKEALAAALMNQDKFKDYFNYELIKGRKDYPGNPELRNLYIGEDNIVDFFRKRLFGAGASFKEKLFPLLDVFYENQDKFDKKWKLWNEWLLSSKEDQSSIMEKYLLPILLI